MRDIDMGFPTVSPSVQPPVGHVVVLSKQMHVASFFSLHGMHIILFLSVTKFCR